VAEGARLESVYTGNRIVGSNPTPSASLLPQPILQPSQAAIKAPNFGSPEVKALHSDSEPAG
jgi:hypothetical protein